MADDSFKLMIFTPAGLELEVQAKSVDLESSEGQIGILPGHVRYVGLLGLGLLRYQPADGSKASELVITGGFCQFANETLTVLADSVDSVESIDREAYSKPRAELQEFLRQNQGMEPEVQEARRKLARIEAIDRLLGEQRH